MAKSNVSLRVARNAKNDEFYTQYSDIEAEMNAYIEFNPDVFRGKTILLPCDNPEWSNFTKYFTANFERFGLKKLISTSYAKDAGNGRLTPFERFDESKHGTHGKLFTLTRDKDGSGRVDTDGIEFSGYLEGDGDFRSDEVRALRNEADIIITNPPFSLFSEFLAWIMEADKRFVIVGSTNAITYKEVFPLLKDNRIWIGTTVPKEFIIPATITERKNTYIREDGTVIAKFGNICWFANIDHGLRHQPLRLDTMAHNLKFNKKLRRKLEHDYGMLEYPRYDNYDAIEIPFVECIPSDYDGVMGVPITFMDKYAPCQFEIVGATESEGSGFSCGIWHERSKVPQPMVHDRRIYKRIFIRPRNRQDDERPSQKVSGQAWDGTGREHGDVMSKRLASLADNTMEDGMR